MSDQKDVDNRLDEMIRKTLAASLDNAGEGCPDADMLAAFAENSLASTERAKWNTHISGCAICQRQLAALARAGAVGPNRDRSFVPAATVTSEIEYVDAEEAREEAGLWHTIRSALRFSLGPMPLSIVLHIAVLLFLIITVHEQRG